MHSHVTALGVLFLVLGALGLLGFLVVVLVFGGAAGIVGLAAPEEPGARIAIPIVGGFGIALGILILVLSVPDIIVGFGLLNLRPWARVLGIVLCVLGLLNFPFGTVVGVYGLWVLLSEETAALFAGPSLPRRTS